MTELINMTSMNTMSIQDEYTKVLSSSTKGYKSAPIMTKYEFNQVVALRTMHLSRGAPPLVTIEEEIKIESNMQLRAIAERELVEGRLPFIVKRPMPNGKIEYWPVGKLDLVAVRNLFRHVTP